MLTWCTHCNELIVSTKDKIDHYIFCSYKCALNFRARFRYDFTLYKKDIVLPRLNEKDYGRSISK